MFLLETFTAFLLKFSQYGISKCCFVGGSGSGIYISCFVPKNVECGFQKSMQ